MAGLVHATLLAPAVSAQAVTATQCTASSTTTSSTATAAATQGQQGRTFVNPLTGVNPGPSPKDKRNRIQPYSLLALPNSGDGTDTGSTFTPETPPAGQPAKAPDLALPAGISFINDPTATIAQQNPDYSASSAQPIFDADGKVTGITIDGKKQDYTAQIPYWCNEGPDGRRGNSHYTLNLCYRPTDLFSGQAQGATVGERLSVIDGKPHIILDDVNADAGTRGFLSTGIIQKAMGNWNKLLGKNFFLLRSQLTQDPNGQSGKIAYDPSRDRMQYLPIKEDDDPNFDAAAGTAPTGYEVSADNGTTWVTTTTIPAVSASSLPVLSQLRVNDATPTGRVWKDKDGNTLGANFGLSDLPDVQVLVRKAATEPVQPSKPDQPGGKDTPDQPGKPSNPSKPATPSSKTQKTASAKKKVSSLASTGVSLGALTVLLVLTSAAGISLCAARHKEGPADSTSVR